MNKDEKDLAAWAFRAGLAQGTIMRIRSLLEHCIEVIDEMNNRIGNPPILGTPPSSKGEGNAEVPAGSGADDEAPPEKVG